MIGLYDSGIGGLTVLSHLRKKMKNIDVVYLADTINLPYGQKPPSLLQEYAEGAFSFFKPYKPSALLVACGTISTVVLENQGAKCAFPLLGVVKPAVKRLSQCKSKRIAVLATRASIQSGVFKRLIAPLGAELLLLPCPSFVPLVEAGKTNGSDRQAFSTVKRELAPLFPFRPDAILLGCTHFPLLSDLIRSFFPYADVIDAGKAAADEIAESTPDDGKASVEFFVTGSPLEFLRSARRIFPSTDPSQVHQITLSAKNKV